MGGRVASYKGLRPSSPRASSAASASSAKANTKCELLLRRRLWSLGCRYRVDVRDLPGRPDIVFTRARVVVFCDGDFWHGRNWEERKKKLARGHNPAYWIRKISGNIERDKRHTAALEEAGWIVLRYWESDIKKDVARIADEARIVVAARLEQDKEASDV